MDTRYLELMLGRIAYGRSKKGSLGYRVSNFIGKAIVIGFIALIVYGNFIK